MFIINALIAFGNWFWGIPILILLGCGGLWITIRVGFLQFRHFGYICSQTFGGYRTKSVDENRHAH